VEKCRHRVTASRPSLIVEEVEGLEPSGPRMMEPGEVHMVPVAEAQACAAVSLVPCSLADMCRAD